MSLMLQYFLLVAVFAYFTMVIYLIKHEKFLLQYGILWLFSGVLMFVLAVFPELLVRLTSFLGVKVASNGLFAICIFLIIMMLVFLTVIVTELAAKIKKLVQKTAIMEKRLKDLEKVNRIVEKQ